MKVGLLYYQFLDHDGRQRLVGGVETYLTNLAAVCGEMGLGATIYQWSHGPFVRNVDGIQVKGMPVCHLPYRKRKDAFLRHVKRELDATTDLVIFGADHLSVRTTSRRAIAIQHGIACDLPVKYLSASILCRNPVGAALRKLKARRDAIRRFENCYNRVCVDYNFFNWYRTIIAEERPGNTWIIPNAAAVAGPDQTPTGEDDGAIHVLFARRFVEFRGTRLFAEVAKRVLERFPQVKFTFAGEGPDEEWLRQFFAHEPRVTMTRYLPQESQSLVSRHHIAVIASLGSEGTSLSVAEAMGAGCAVLATCVGGITNMIIDGYNGLMVMPTAQGLHGGLTRLLSDPALRHRLGSQGRGTAAAAFGLHDWKQRWKSVLDQVGGL